MLRSREWVWLASEPMYRRREPKRSTWDFLARTVALFTVSSVLAAWFGFWYLVCIPKWIGAFVILSVATVFYLLGSYFFYPYVGVTAPATSRLGRLQISPLMFLMPGFQDVALACLLFDILLLCLAVLCFIGWCLSSPLLNPIGRWLQKAEVTALEAEEERSERIRQECMQEFYREYHLKAPSPSQPSANP